MASTTNLSPVTQTVLEACWKARDRALDEEDMLGLAAALRAAADQVAPLSTNRRQDDIRQKLLAIATELEDQ
jgi:hypothetical protein